MFYTNHSKIQSNQEECEVYQIKEDLYEIMASIKDIDSSTFKVVLQILRKKKISDILEFFQKKDNHMFQESFTNNIENQMEVENKIVRIANILRNIQNHSFSKNDFSSQIYEKERLNLIKKISGNQNIIDFLKFLVQLTTIDQKFIQCGSNGLNLLVQMKVDLKNQSFEYIRIRDTSLIGGNFVRCNLSGSEFENVDISLINLNGALLLNCKWKNIKIHELNKLDGLTWRVNSVNFSPDGTTLASGNDDKSIRLWDVKTGQQKAKLDGHNSLVLSVCFSPDGATLASGSYDNSIRLWDVKTGQQKAKLDGHSECVQSVSFSPDGTTLASGSNDKSIRLWDVKTGQQKAKLDGHIYINHQNQLLIILKFSLFLYKIIKNNYYFSMDFHIKMINQIGFNLYISFNLLNIIELYLNQKMNNSNQTHLSCQQSTYSEGQTIEKEVQSYNQRMQRIEKIKIQIKLTLDQQIIYSQNGAILRVVEGCDVIERLETFNNMDQIQNLSWQGQYGKNKKKDGKWIAFWTKELLKNVGGYYKEGQKYGLWKDLFLNYWKEAQIFETGEFQSDLRIGKWNYIYQNAKIGGGSYNKDGYKQGKWIDLDEVYYNDKSVTYNGEYNKNGMKVGIWDIMHFNKQMDEYKYMLQRGKFSGGGSYDQNGNQKKIGKWVELDEGFCYKQVTCWGEYNRNGRKVGEYKKIISGGGTYDQEGNQKKIGKWVELDEGFNENKQITYKGEFNTNGIKVGQWDTIFCKYIDEGYQQMGQILCINSGGGSYEKKGGQIKIGKWVELDEGFNENKQVTYNGEYNMNGIKVGKQDIMYQRNQMYIFINGGGKYDLEGSQQKRGKWIELDEKFSKYNQVTYNGEYNIQGQKIGRWNRINLQYQDKLCGFINFDENGIEIYRSESEAIIYAGSFKNRKKIGRWDILYSQYDEYKQIGGGKYDLEGSQKKRGKWLDLDEGFGQHKQVIYHGEYNKGGMKVGRWNIMCSKQNDQGYKQIGGGSYDQEGNQKKIGKWVELDLWLDYKQVTYSGEYNMDGKKVGRWDIMYCKYNEGYKQIGGGSYDQEGNQNKIGKWIELDDQFYEHKQVTYIGEYNMNGIKIGRWDIMYCKYDNEKYQQMYKGIYSGGGSYDQGGNQKKIGKWVEFDEKFKPCKQITYNGEYNMDGIKVGRWDIMYCKYDNEKYQQMHTQWWRIYDQGGNQKKIGKWIELDESFCFRMKNCNEVTYDGEYNMEGQKVGIWVEMDIHQKKKRGERYYDN
ncbi:unnamed protein product [Paramecium sonneborni]|uniref:CAF1B/HIR1 beta-propeller domain-containing protein n=1 Tax=Paramecium sonneborni TaxID=65129 RepID=A0A8S1P9H0_9CILI|nr:unnamed protein product [Paramecium sonneborni]